MHSRLNYALYLVTDNEAARGRALVHLVEAAVEGGVTLVQLRKKDLDTAAFIKVARPVREILWNHEVPLIISDDLEAALAVEADGVHLGRGDTPWHVVRRRLGDDAVIGLTVKTMDQLRQAKYFDIDYLGVGPVFLHKPDRLLHEAWGLERLTQAVGEANRPVVAIGGIKRSNVRDVVATGVAGVAVVSALCAANDVTGAAKDLRVAVEAARKRRA